ncbi:zinc/iron regulated transporter-related protein 102B [Dermatophagoides farinae]|uniref:zinc/iron regulated transporter-related protein 102B n=1 Tax=Dermatophagoides farinae TaxID=6954 RepID=UPI003F5E73DE
MDQLFFLILLNCSIGFGSYIAGTIPILFYLSESKVRLFSVFGAGILIGAALCVIIPEGISSIYQSGQQQIHHHHDERRSLEHNSSIISIENDDNHIDEQYDPHTVIGLTLLIGFVTMLIVDQFSTGMTNGGSHGGYSQLTTTTTTDSSIAIDSESNTSNHHHHHHSNKKSTSKLTATIGLIVHSAADGIALGAAATTSHADVEMIVFLAILLHKAPAAFGLVTFLLHEGLDRNRAKRHLFWFSISAPTASFITYFGINSSSQQTFHEYNATGVSLLFSAGTFLYVAAVHVLPEITQHRRLKIKELFLLIGGSFLPSLLTIKHHH